MRDDNCVVQWRAAVVPGMGTLLLLVFVACKGGGAPATTSPAAPQQAEAQSPGEQAEAPPAEPVDDAEGSDRVPAPPAPAHWAYEGEHGPDRWAETDPKFTVCGSGREQSPIDIRSTRKGRGKKPLAIDYKRATDTTIVNNGHTVQVNYEKGSRLTVDGEQYEVAQFHVHTPSEHWVDGVAAAAELHIVHKNSRGELAVVGVLLRDGPENRFLGDFLAEMPETESERPLAASLDLAQALPKDRHYYTYPGSLTTPPCTEGVRWLVMKEPMTIGKEQLARVSALIGMNARPPQPLNGRTVEEGR